MKDERAQTFIAIFCKCEVGVDVNAHKWVYLCQARGGRLLSTWLFKMLSPLALYGARFSNSICTLLCLYVVNIKTQSVIIQFPFAPDENEAHFKIFNLINFHYKITVT